MGRQGFGFAIRVLCVLSNSLWVGGLTFYGAAVLPRMHEFFGKPDSALVTREVSYVLNLIGVTSLGLWWVDVALDRRRSGRRLRRTQIVSLVVSTLILAGLFVGHARLADRVDSSFVGTRLFYLEHRAYLIASTTQWAANLVLLISSLALWTGAFSANQGSQSTEKRNTQA